MPVPKHAPEGAESQTDRSVSDLLALGSNPLREQLGTKRCIQEPPSGGVAPQLLRHHPSNWEIGDVDGVVYWLPEICVHPVFPGAAGIRTRGPQDPVEASWEDAKHREEKKGWVYIDCDQPVPDHALPAGMPRGSLPVRQYEVRDPATGATGVRWEEAWKIPMPSLPDERQVWKFDRPAYNRWRLWLVETGQVAPPLEHVIRRRLANLADRVARVPTHVSDDVRKRMLEPRQAVAKAAEQAKVPAKKKAA